jgi:hypothetical protein
VADREQSDDEVRAGMPCEINKATNLIEIRGLKEILKALL